MADALSTYRSQRDFQKTKGAERRRRSRPNIRKIAMAAADAE
ncbi:hypothetical protein OS035_05995 [Rhizobium sp. 268]